jgi:putative transcriptional regulator
MSSTNTEYTSISHHLLVAMPGLLDPIFSKAVIYLAEHSGKGAMGIVINKPCELDLRALLSRLNLNSVESKTTSSPVYYGGPIQQDRGFVLHEPVGTWSSTLRINDGLALTSSKDILEATANGVGPKKILVSLGYSGWGPGQLDSELAANSWLTVPLKNNHLLFDTPAEIRFAEAFKILGVDPDNLSSITGHA